MKAKNLQFEGKNLQSEPLNLRWPPYLRWVLGNRVIFCRLIARTHECVVLQRGLLKGVAERDEEKKRE